MDWKIVLSAVLLVVVLVIALNLRKKITRNEDNQGMFKPYRLKVEGEESVGDAAQRQASRECDEAALGVPSEEGEKE